MKKLIILITILIPMVCLAQTKKDIYNPEVQFVFLGADFSQTQFTKSDRFNNKPEILRFFVDCNNLFDTDRCLNYMKKKLRRDEIKYDFSYVAKNNGSVDWQKVYSDDVNFSLSDEDIQNIISNLNIDQVKYKNHIGMLLCNENFSKTNLRGTIAEVFINVDNLKPILIKRYSFKPSGYGFLFYWSNVDFQAINNLKKLRSELK